MIDDKRLDDRTMLLDALVSDKHEASDYTIRSIETGNKNLLNLFQDIYRDEQQHVHMFMDAMTQRGWQTALQARPEDINKIKGEAQNKAAQMHGQGTQQMGRPAGGPGIEMPGYMASGPQEQAEKDFRTPIEGREHFSWEQTGQRDY